MRINVNTQHPRVSLVPIRMPT